MNAWIKKAFGLALSAALAVGVFPMTSFGDTVDAAAAQPEDPAPLLAPALVESAISDESGLIAQSATDERVTVLGAVRYDDVHKLIGLINVERAKQGLKVVKLDETLTGASMQRAAELAIYYAHVRPNGEKPDTAITPPDKRAKYGTVTEVSVIERATPEDVLAACLDDAENRSKVLSADFNSVGIGNFSQGVACWNLMFSAAEASGSVTNGQRNLSFPVDVNYDVCGTRQEFNMNTPLANMQQLNVGQTFTMEYCIENAGYKKMFAHVQPTSVTWSSSNPAVCTIDGQTGTVTARSAGTATITAKLGSGKSISHTWSVSQAIASIAPNTVPDQTYTGVPVKPRPVLRSGSRLLSEGTDYALSYEYNTNVGIASMTITGMGSFTGTRRLEFRILPAQNWTVSLSETQFLYDGEDKTPVVTVTFNGKKMVEDKDYYVSYPGDRKSKGNHTITVTAMGNFTGSQAANYSITDEPVSNESRDVMYRLYNPNSGEHFYTANAGERDSLSGVGWNYEGVGWLAPKTSRTPVYRLYSGTDHHYTTEVNERDALVAAGWSFEGVGWYSVDSKDDAKRVPLYRQFNPNVNPAAPFNNSGSHNYTTSKAENDTLVQNGWNEEGIGWYGVRQ